MKVERRDDPQRGYPGVETRASGLALRSNAASRLVSRGTRRALSLTEVLIAMGILTIGLLGVASVFPVGSFYMQKGEIADRGSAIAQAAFNDALVRGTLNPENWLVWHEGTNQVVGVTGPELATLPTPPTNFTFTRPFAELMRRSKTNLLASAFSPIQQKQQLTREYGSVFMIDPAGVSSISTFDPNSNLMRSSNSAWRCGNFPSSSPAIVSATSPQWQTWADSGSLGIRWPIRRVTLRGSYTGSTGAGLFNKLMTSSDDLSLDPPNAQDKPTVQPWRMVDADNDGDRDDPLTRMARGNYSWVITVAPTTAEARDALATDPSGHMYEVSVVVFFRRALSTTSPVDDSEMIANRELLQKNERVVRASVVSTGLSGGEILLEKFAADGEAEDPFLHLKTGNWVMLCGPHPNSTDERPMMVSRWYKVLAIEGKDEKLNAQGNVGGTDNIPRRLVSLRGPQWPWQPAPNLTGYDSHISNALYVCIPTGAVAVHSKTIRLEGNSVHNGGVNSLTSK